jgi:hypothetical protein
MAQRSKSAMQGRRQASLAGRLPESCYVALTLYAVLNIQS